MNYNEDDLPFESPNYQENNIKTLSNIKKLLEEIHSQNNQVEVSNLFDTLESYLKFKLKKLEFKTDFRQMEELVEYLEYLFIPVYGDWDRVDDKYSTKIARVIKEHLNNGIVREIEIIIGEDETIKLEIKGFGDYDKVILEKDLGNDGKIIYFKVRK
ncbi:hypothetical protein CHH83_17280 [Bacillus sp. 7586-K]|nr:hypothetical protein CHH83_17280 [Bacillus sp. 7586-K]